jgi:hypothetical protein
MCVTTTNPLANQLMMPTDPSDLQAMETYLSNLDQALRTTVHSDRLNTLYEVCIRDVFPGMPLRLADLNRQDLENIDFGTFSADSIKQSLLANAERMRRAEIKGSCLDIYASMIVLLNSQLLELEVMESRSKKDMESTAFKAMQCVVKGTNSMAYTQLIAGGVGSVLGLGSALISDQSWQRGLLAAAQNAPTAGQFFTTKQQADLTLSQHEQQVATEKWRSKQEQAKQIREEVRRSLDQLIQKIAEIFQKMPA